MSKHGCFRRQSNVNDFRQALSIVPKKDWNAPRVKHLICKMNATGTKDWRAILCTIPYIPVNFLDLLGSGRVRTNADNSADSILSPTVTRDRESMQSALLTHAVSTAVNNFQRAKNQPKMHQAAATSHGKTNCELKHISQREAISCRNGVNCEQ